MAYSECEVAHEADVRVKGDPPAVSCLRRQVSQALEFPVEGPILAVEPLVLPHYFDTRVDVHDTRIPIDDHLVTLAYGLEQVVHSDDRRNLERFRQDRCVRRHPARREHDTLQVPVLHHREIGHRKLIGHQHRVPGQGLLAFFESQQVTQKSPANVSDVERPITQVVVGHVRKSADVLVHDALERRLGSVARLDFRFDPLVERLVLEHHAVHVENRVVEIWQSVEHPPLELAHLFDRPFDRAPVACSLGPVAYSFFRSSISASRTAGSRRCVRPLSETR